MPARPDGPYGFMPYQGLKRANWYPVASKGMTIAKFDLVRLTAGGGVGLARAGDKKRILGTALAFIDANEVPQPYFASGAVGYRVLVADHPDQFFHVQEDHSATTVKLADVNLGVNFVRTHRYSSVSFRSRAEIASNTKAATGVRQLRIVGELTNEDAVGTLSAPSYKRWIVQVLQHEFIKNRPV